MMIIYFVLKENMQSQLQQSQDMIHTLILITFSWFVMNIVSDHLKHMFT
jgi:hypothetical protein